MKTITMYLMACIFTLCIISVQLYSQPTVALIVEDNNNISERGDATENLPQEINYNVAPISYNKKSFVLIRDYRFTVIVDNRAVSDQLFNQRRDTTTIRNIASLYKLSIIPFIGYGISDVELGKIYVNGFLFTTCKQSDFIYSGLQVLYGNSFQIGAEFNYALKPMRFNWDDNIELEIKQLSLSTFTKYHFDFRLISTNLRAGIGLYTGDVSLIGLNTRIDHLKNDTIKIEFENKFDIFFHIGLGFSYPFGERISLIAETNYNFVNRATREGDNYLIEKKFRLNSITGNIGLDIIL